jgi:hypothetical protein
MWQHPAGTYVPEEVEANTEICSGGEAMSSIN